MWYKTRLQSQRVGLIFPKGNQKETVLFFFLSFFLITKVSYRHG